MNDKARELLAAEYGSSLASGTAAAIRKGGVAIDTLYGPALRAINAALRTAPEGIKPVAWIRYCSDGCYEGPIMDGVIEDVRRKSGVWTPLYTLAAVMEAE